MDNIILHIDMNSFFASVEQQANPFLRGKPIGVTGKRTERSVVAAASIEAKRLGVKTAMSTWEAKRICPQLILVAGDSEKYSQIHHQFNTILCEFTDRVEPFSVDESFADITRVAQDDLGAICVAQTIRARLHEVCGECVTASIGIAPNKILAKLASDMVKPNGITLIRPRDAISLLDRTALQDICGIGPRVAAHLEMLGILNVKQLREYPLELLVREFKSFGPWLHNVAHGRGDDFVTPVADEQKSYGHSYTLPRDTSDPTVVRRYLLRLCDKVAWRLRRDGVSARCVTAYVRFGDFSSFGKQHRFREPINDGLTIFNVAWSLLSDPPPLSSFAKGFGGPAEALCEGWQGGDRGGLRFDEPIRLVGISVSDLIATQAPQSFFPKQQKMRATLRALDLLQHRFGEHTWTRAALLATDIKPRSSGFQFDHEL